jgi:hypothetical protein
MEGIEPSPTEYHTVVLPLTPHQRYWLSQGESNSHLTVISRLLYR